MHYLIQPTPKSYDINAIVAPLCRRGNQSVKKNKELPHANAWLSQVSHQSVPDSETQIFNRNAEQDFINEQILDPGKRDGAWGQGNDAILSLEMWIKIHNNSQTLKGL